MKSTRREIVCETPEDTFSLGGEIGASLVGGELIFLRGTLGAGKTLLTKGIVGGIGFDIDEVTSPSFTLLNEYNAEKFDVYHIDLWRIAGSRDALIGIGLDELFENENCVIIIEWAERLGEMKFEKFERSIVNVEISGDGDDPRKVVITRAEFGTQPLQI